MTFHLAKQDVLGACYLICLVAKEVSDKNVEINNRSYLFLVPH